MFYNNKASVVLKIFYLFIYLFIYLLIYLERGREGERGNINVWLPLACPLLGTWPTTQACALEWASNWQCLDSQAGTQPLSHTSQELFNISQMLNFHFI